jgi:hypothetical protein
METTKTPQSGELVPGEVSRLGFVEYEAGIPTTRQ